MSTTAMTEREAGASALSASASEKGASPASRTERVATDWLPVEMWAAVVALSDRQSRAALAATCGDLRHLVLKQARASSRKAREALNGMVDGWECHTAHWDGVWSQRDARGRCYACATIGGAHHVQGATRRRWISDCGTPSDPTATDLCDACALSIARDLKGWPMRRVDLDAPHVWSVGRTICDVLDLLPTTPIADGHFVVPTAATYMVSPGAATAIAAWTPGEAEVGFAGLRPSRMPSIRAWLPLACVRDEAHESAACVCCDIDSALWGAVVVVDWWQRASFVGWTRVGDSVEDVVVRHRRRTQDPSRPPTLGIIERILTECARTARPPHVV